MQRFPIYLETPAVARGLKWPSLDVSLDRSPADDNEQVHGVQVDPKTVELGRRVRIRLELDETCSRGDLLAAALAYARRLGWHVLPVYEVDDAGHCACGNSGCGSPGKHPRVNRGVKDATTDPATITEWWGQWPRANIGIATGKTSGISVLDQDGPEGGAALKRNPPIRTPTVRTGGSDRLHYYLADPRGHIKNRTKFEPGLDLKGDGGYVVAPPSRHASGEIYEWIVLPDIPPAPAPAWLIEPAAEPSRATTDNRPGNPYLEAARHGTEAGWRHDVALQIGGSLLGRGVEPEVAKIVLRYYATRCRPPHDPEDCDRIVDDLATKDAVKFGDSVPPLRGAIGSESNFHPERAADLLSAEPEPERWLWDCFLPFGTVTLLAGYMKTGKTTFAYPLALAVAHGQPFLGYPTRQAAVLILAIEEPSRLILGRLRRFGLRSTDCVHLHRGRLAYDNKTLAAIKAFVVEQGVRLLMIDTLSTFWGIRDENNNTEVIQRFKPLLILARETDCAVLVLHHERKSGGDDGRSIRGGSALFGLVDQALLLERRQGGDRNQRVLRTLGRYDESPPELVIALEDDVWSRLGTTEELGKDAARQKVLPALTDTPQDVAMLVETTGLAKRAVREALAAGGAAIIREGKGRKGSPFTYRLQDSIRPQPGP
jgi:hypothetical protein